jgi:hypothetical protein
LSGHHERHRSKLQRHRQCFEDQAQNLGPFAARRVVEVRPARGGPVRGPHEGLAEIATHDAADVASELDDDRIPQAHVGCDLLDQGFGRHSAGHQPHGISRHDPQQREDQQRDEEDDEDALGQTPHEKIQDEHP